MAMVAISLHTGCHYHHLNLHHDQNPHYRHRPNHLRISLLPRPSNVLRPYDDRAIKEALERPCPEDYKNARTRTRLTKHAH